MWVLVSFLALPWFQPAAGQNLTLRPPLVDRGGQQTSSVLFRSSETVTLGWEEPTVGLRFRIGLEPGEYGYTSFSMRGTTSSQFTPDVVGLPVGVYYGVLTNIPAAFTDIGIGAEGTALGFTGVAGIQGADALAWNPASIVPRAGMELSFSWVDQLGLVDFGYMAWSMPLRSGRSAIGASAEVSGDDMLREATLRAAYSHRIRRVWVGLGVGYRRADYGRNRLSADDYVVFDPDEVTSGINQQVSGSANGLLIDAGLRIEVSRRMDLAVSARNVLAPTQWVSQSAARPGSKSYFESVPMEVSTGLAYRLSERLAGFMSWTPSLGSDAIPRVGLGASFTPVDVLTLRVGRMMVQDRSHDAWKTFGFGLRTPQSRDWSISADYAYVVSPLARTQQITLRFGL